MLRHTLDLLKHKGQFICRYTDESTFTWLSETDNQLAVRNALAPYGFDLGELWGTQDDRSSVVYFCRYASLEHPSDIQAASRYLSTLPGELKTVINILTRLSATDAFDEQFRPGMHISFGALLEALERRPSLKEQFNQLASLGSPKLAQIAAKSSLEDKLKICLTYLKEADYLVSQGKDSSYYITTGKCAFFTAWLGQMADLYEIESSDEEPEQIGLAL